MANLNDAKIILIGDGGVGSAFAYCNVLQGIGRELGIIDIKEDRVNADVLDLEDATGFTARKRVYQATYENCKDADIVVITAGIPQKPGGETRLDLVDKNLPIFKKMVGKVVDSGFDGIFVVASNPVDILTYATWKFSGFPKERVIGSGTSLDTARFRAEISKVLDVDPRDIIAYVLGEHGDSEFGAWSHVAVGGQPIEKFATAENRLADETYQDEVSDYVRNKAYDIINGKGATYYGVAACLNRICRAILDNEHAVLPVSAYLDGHYGQHDVFTGTPAIISSKGLEQVVELQLTDKEQALMKKSCSAMKEIQTNAFAKLEQ